MCGELVRQFNTSSKTVRFYLHRLGKTYKLSKWVLHTLLEFHKQQRVAACLSLLSHHRRASIFNRVLTSDEKWVPYGTPKRYKHWLSPPGYCPASARPPMHPRKIMLLSGGLVVKWFTMSCYQWAKWSLWICIRSNWNVYN
ncbi:histone-lysine N-methyltransferase SETMAR [Trichonephila clavipes]|nr:histone-lysine N-methyltransferase SETMAR [Trichonephila clavipes]